MAPPNKRKRQLLRLQEAKRHANEKQQIDLELLDPVAIADDNFDLDCMLDEPEIIGSRLELMLKWNPAAEHSLRSAYTGDSKRTKYRRLKEKQDRHRAVADCPRIDNFSRKNPVQKCLSAFL